MQLSYQKLGSDHPMYGKVDYVVADGMTPLCYKTKDGYVPLAGGSMPTTTTPSLEQAAVTTKPLYVLSFKVNDDAEELTFSSKQALDKTLELYAQKPFITDIKTTTYQVVV